MIVKSWNKRGTKGSAGITFIARFNYWDTFQKLICTASNSGFALTDP